MIKHTGNGLGSDPLPWGASWEVYMGEPNQIITFEHKLTSFSKFTSYFFSDSDKKIYNCVTL